MSIESWEPAAQAATVDTGADKLQRLADLAAAADFGDNAPLDSQLNAAAQDHCRALMQLSREAWTDIARELSSDTLRNLIRFFTVAESQVSGCEVGAASPVVALNQELKRRDDTLSREELLWIRSHSDNRFLPNGPL